MGTFVLIIMLKYGPLALPGFHTKVECENTFVAIEQVLAFNEGLGTHTHLVHSHQCRAADDGKQT